VLALLPATCRSSGHDVCHAIRKLRRAIEEKGGE